jgi:integrase
MRWVGKEMRPPSPGEVARLLAHVAAIQPLFHLFLVLAAMTGARRGQLLALRWIDIDFERGSVSFQRALVEGPDGPVLAPTKTRRSYRVALDPGTIALLRARFDEVSSNSPSSHRAIEELMVEVFNGVRVVVGCLRPLSLFDGAVKDLVNLDDEPEVAKSPAPVPLGSRHGAPIGHDWTLNVPGMNP